MLRRAIELNPNYAPAHHWLSMAAAESAELDEAWQLAERPSLLDPLSAIINDSAGLHAAGESVDSRRRSRVQAAPSKSIRRWRSPMRLLATCYVYGLERLCRRRATGGKSCRASIRATPRTLAAISP